MNIIDFHSINRKYENKIHSRDISPNSTERVSLLSHGPSAFLSHSFLKNSELVGQNLDSFRNASKLVHVDSRAPVEPKENVCGRADISVAPA